MRQEEFEEKVKEQRKRIIQCEKQIKILNTNYINKNCNIKLGDILFITHDRSGQILKETKYITRIQYYPHSGSYKKEFLLFGKDLKTNGQMYKKNESVIYLWDHMKPAIKVIGHGEVPGNIEEFIDKHKPMKENRNVNDSWYGYMFDVGADAHIEMIAQAEVAAKSNNVNKVAKHIWTLIESGNHTYISAGHHVVNREGYFVTEIPYMKYQENIDILVH